MLITTSIDHINNSFIQTVYTEKFGLKLVLSNVQRHFNDMLNVTLKNINDDYFKTVFIEEVDEKYMENFFSDMKWLQFYNLIDFNFDSLLYAIYLGNIPIGFYSIRGNKEETEYSYGIFIEKKYSGKGYATDIIQTSLKQIENSFNCVEGYEFLNKNNFMEKRKLVWLCQCENIPSIKIAQNTGFVEKERVLIENNMYIQFEKFFL